MYRPPSICLVSVPGHDLAFDEYHRVVCPLMTRFEYDLLLASSSSSSNKQQLIEESDQLTAKLLVRLLAGLVSRKDAGDDAIKGLEEAARMEDPMLLRDAQTKNDASQDDSTASGGSGEQAEAFRHFLQLLPQPLTPAEHQFLEPVASLFKDLGVSRSAVAYALARFRGNNHVVSDERLRPIGNVVL